MRRLLKDFYITSVQVAFAKYDAVNKSAVWNTGQDFWVCENGEFRRNYACIYLVTVIFYA